MMKKATEQCEGLRLRNEDETDVQAVPAVIGDEETGPLTNAQFLCVAGPELGTTFLMPRAQVTIGRGAGEISLTTSDVSRTHARVSRRDRGFWIEDLSSSNGTYVNGSQIVEPIELRFGDRVQLGSTILVFTRNDELEQRLRQLQKVEAMHGVVKGLAHDFNNTMQVLLVGLDQLKSLAHDDETRSILDEMLTAAISGSGLVRRMLRIGRDKPATQDIVDLDGIVRVAVSLARRVMPSAVYIDVDACASGLIRGSKSELEQALLNALINARDAMPDGGKIVLSTRLIELDRAAAHARHLARHGMVAEIVVRDEGMGMDAATLAHCFEPFFTTKPGKGTGLGLAMIYSSVKNHGGTVDVESARGSGTIVTILLPVIA